MVGHCGYVRREHDTGWFVFDCALGVAVFLTVAGGQYADKKIAAGIEVIKVRKRLVTTGYGIVILSVLMLTMAPNIAIATIMCTLLFAGVAILIPGYTPIPSELLPRHADILYGIMSAAGSIGSAIYVALTGILLDYSGSYNSIFSVLIVTATVGMILFNLFGRATSIDDADGLDENS